MKTNTSTRILKYIQTHDQASPKELGEYLEVSQVAVFKQLKKLVDSDKVQKIGKSPKTFYILKPNQNATKNSDQEIASDKQKTVEENFLYISPQGNLDFGLAGFKIFCQSKDLNFVKTIDEYLKTLAKYSIHKGDNDLIDSTFKLQESFGDQVAVDEMYYFDFYAIERFGKTKLAQLTFQAKQSQDKNLTKQIIEITKVQILNLIIHKQIQAVAFIPPTVDRKLQFIKEYKQGLALPLPSLEVIKVIQQTPVQQKTLKKQAERILNASSTILVTDKRKFSNILLIDDFVGSGATFNEVAKKIRKRNLLPGGKIIALAITGSYKGFEVVNQV